MIILHVAVFSANSTNVWQAKAFERLGHDVLRFDYRAIAQKYGIEERDRSLIRICQTIKPEIALFSKCNQMDISVIKACNPHTTTILWMMDNWHNMDAELIEKVKHCHINFFAGWRELEMGVKLNKNSFKLHGGGFDSEVHKPIDVPKKYDTSFIGGLYNYRRPYHEAVGFPVITGVYGLEHSKVVSQTRINLSLLEGSSPSNRLYKILATKGFCLTNPWEYIEREFTVGTHLDTFESPEELKEKIAFYLPRKELRKKIAEAGYKKVQEYNDTNYAQIIIDKYNELIS